jgi:outer membrane protein OmpA-like peptidoglycan-associated protein
MLESSYEELDRVAGMLKKNPNIEIELSGHTDNTGSSKLNIELSQKRSDTVQDYLINKGVSAKRLKSKGYGGSRPIASNRSEATRKLNRRVEFTIIKN